MDSESSLSEPFRWAIIPIVLAFFGVGILYYFLHRRRTRRYALQYGADRSRWPQNNRAGHLVPSRSRWGNWAGTRSQEGLNELGEAPPPYGPKQDDEEGARPPEYPAEPPPAVTTESRRSA